MMPIIEVVDRVVLVRNSDQDHARKAHGNREHDDEGVDQRFELGGHHHIDQDQREDCGEQQP